jgi:hypothetical protein
MVHRVPAGLDAAHVGFIFIDVVGNGHCGAPSSGTISQSGLSMPILFPIPSLVAGSSRDHPGCASSIEALPRVNAKHSPALISASDLLSRGNSTFIAPYLSSLKNLIRIIGLQEKPAIYMHCYEQLPA